MSTRYSREETSQNKKERMWNIRREIHKKSGRRDEDRRNEAGDEKANEEKDITVNGNSQVKPVIKRFEGTHIDWFRFWNQLK